MDMSYWQQAKEEDAKLAKNFLRACLAMTFSFIVLGMLCYWLVGCSSMDQLTDQDKAELQDLINSLPGER